MKETELRLGNFYISSGVVSQVKEDDYMNWHVNGCWAEPIPLTEKWLVGLGFKEETGFTHAYWEIDSFSICFENDIFAYNSFEIPDVHSLQNLYFALTGEELEYTPTKK